MRVWHKKEKERLLISVFIALLFHICLFLIIEYGDFLQIEETAQYIGPMTVELSEYTTIPEKVKELPPAEETIEQPPVEQREEAPEEQEVTEQPEEAVKTAPKAEEQPAEEDGTATTSAEQEKATPAESVPESSYQIPSPSPTQEEQQENHLFNGTDKGNEFAIKMSSVAETAKPNIGPSIAEELPAIAQRIEKTVEVKFSFILGSDGRITHLYIDKSSGYPQIDNAIRRTLLQWKFSRPLREETVEGEFTYVLKP